MIASTRRFTPPLSTTTPHQTKRGHTATLPMTACVVQLILAYEWLISGIDKFINPNFTIQLAKTIASGLNGNPYGPYVALVRAIVLPNASLFGLLTEIGEVGIGATLALATVVCIWRPGTRLSVHAGLAASGALAGATFLSLNYFLQTGSPLPWVDGANAFREGIGIDILLPAIAVTLLVANLRAVRHGIARSDERESHQSNVPQRAA